MGEITDTFKEVKSTHDLTQVPEDFSPNPESLNAPGLSASIHGDLFRPSGVESKGENSMLVSAVTQATAIVSFKGPKALQPRDHPWCQPLKHALAALAMMQKCSGGPTVT